MSCGLDMSGVTGLLQSGEDGCIIGRGRIYTGCADADFLDNETGHAVKGLGDAPDAGAAVHVIDMKGEAGHGQGSGES
jgi:hypothetical protein